MSSHIQKLIREGEHQQLDFKFEISDSKRIARSLVAFANTDGGRLLLGVKDNGKIAGVRSEEEFFMLEAAARMYCRPEATYQVHRHVIEGRVVLEVVVPRRKDELYHALDGMGRWRVYIRVADQNLLANGVLLKVWKQRENPRKGVAIYYQREEEMLLSYLSENERITLSGYCKLAGISRRMAEKILVNLILVEMIDIYLTEQEAYYTLKTPLST